MGRIGADELFRHSVDFFDLMETPLFLVGPTGVGKSALALEIALQEGAAILSMDSMQVYCDLNLGTSKPTPEEQKLVTHGGLDVAKPTEHFDVAKYLKEAQAFLEKSRATKAPVLVVGGTGLYFRALTQGLCEVPEIDAAVKARVADYSLEELQRLLSERDPAIYQTIDFQNPRRLQRALEVIESTGVSLTEWRRRNSAPLIPQFRAFFMQHESLRERIDKRVVTMWNQGWPEEVRGLIRKYGEEAVTRFSAIGYRSIAEFIKSGGSPLAVQESIGLETWHYAKRQLTWFRRESSVRPLKISVNSSMSDLKNMILKAEVER